MMRSLISFVAIALVIGWNGPVHGQTAVEDAGARAEDVVDDAVDATEDAADDAQERAEDFAKEVDRSPQAREVSAGILKPIYSLAEKMSFPAFYWLAFSGMVAGVISFGLQLVLGKLVVLARMGFSLTEILSDALGLAISLVGLVLATQAATQNSTFAASPTAVISATLVGGLAGFFFYIWGQRQELQAVEGRRHARTVVDARDTRP